MFGVRWLPNRTNCTAVLYVFAETKIDYFRGEMGTLKDPSQPHLTQNALRMSAVKSAIFDAIENGIENVVPHLQFISEGARICVHQFCVFHSLLFSFRVIMIFLLFQ